MKIKNETHWRTDHIRAIALRVARDQLMEPQQIAAMHIHIRYSVYGRRGWRHRLGEACLGVSPAQMSRWMGLYLKRDKVDTVVLAHTIAHEIGHQKGLHHRDMKGRPVYDYSTGWRDLYAWASYMPVEPRPARVRPPKPEPTREDRAQASYAEAAAKVKEWQTKIKRAQTMLKKWQRRAKIRQRKLATVASVPGPAASAGPDGSASETAPGAGPGTP